MTLLDQSSLSATLDATNALLFDGKRPSHSQSVEILWWLSGRCGLHGSYAGMPAPTERDFDEGIRTFTGEKVKTRAGIAHLLGEEACRVLALLAEVNSDARAVGAKASAGMSELLDAHLTEAGTYCCGKCSIALWRHVAAGGFRDRDPERLLFNGVTTLKSERDGRGAWGNRFPFWYTVLTLDEMEIPEARAELRYAAHRLERLPRYPQADLFAERHASLAARVLARR